jgi:hypothetical protein
MYADAAEQRSLQGSIRQPTGSNRSIRMTASTTVRSPHRRMRGSLALLAASAAVAGGVIVLGSSGRGDGSESQSISPSNAEVLSGLTPEQRRYVEWVSSAPTEQVAAAFGTDGVQKVRPAITKAR